MATVTTVVNGRAELQRLRAALDATEADRRVRVVSVTGVGGMGKTTLLRAWMAELTARDPGRRVRVGYGASGHAPNEYAVVRWALKSLLDNERAADRHMAKRLVGIIRTVAPEWLNAIPGIGGILRALMVTADAAWGTASRPLPFVDQLINLVIELAAESPVVLLLDDLHWADDSSADLIFDLVRAAHEASAPLLLVCAFRLEGAGDDQRISQNVRALARYVSVIPLAIQPLDADSVAKIIRDETGLPPPPILTEWFRKRTNGNPLFAIELVRVIQNRGLLSADDWTQASIREAIHVLDNAGSTLPDSVEAVLRERLQGLTSSERRTLDIAAVLGEPVHVDDLLAISDIPETAVRESLRALCQRLGLLVSQAAGAANTYSFAYDLLPDLLLRLLRADGFDYTQIHLRCAEHLELNGERSDFATWVRLASHWREAGHLDCAVTAAHRGAWRGYRDATVRERALTLAKQMRAWCSAESPDLIAQCEMVIAEAEQARSNPSGAFAALRRAQAIAPAGTASFGHVLFFQAGVEAAGNLERGRIDLAEQGALVIEAIDSAGTARPIRSLHHHLRITARLAAVSHATAANDPDQGHRLLETVAQAVSQEEWASDWGDFAYQLSSRRAHMHAMRNSWQEAVAAYTEAIDERLHSGWPEHSVSLRKERAIALCHLGDEATGIEEIRQCLRLARDVYQTPHGVAGCLYELGTFYWATNRWTEALELLLLAERIYEEIGYSNAATVSGQISVIREAIGADAFNQWRQGFRPEDSEWGQYALLWGIGTLTKHPGNPVLTPTGDTWQSYAVFNPAAHSDGATVTLLYRAMNTDTSVIGLATSADGHAFDRAPSPVLSPTEAWELPGGCEDPRLGLHTSDFLLTYTAFDGTTARAAAARSADLRTWHKKGRMFADNDWNRWFPREQLPDVPPGWTKSAVLIPGEVDGRRWIYFGDTHIWAAWTDDPDMTNWRVVRRPVLSPRPGGFDARLVEPGPAPFWTPEGIVLIYNAADEDLRYAVGQVLLSPEDPTRVLRRCARPILEVTAPAERDGRVRNVVFATGLVHHQGSWLLYYGMGDTAIGVASATHPAFPLA